MRMTIPKIHIPKWALYASIWRWSRVESSTRLWNIFCVITQRRVEIWPFWLSHYKLHTSIRNKAELKDLNLLNSIAPLGWQTYRDRRPKPSEKGCLVASLISKRVSVTLWDKPGVSAWTKGFIPSSPRCKCESNLKFQFLLNYVACSEKAATFALFIWRAIKSSVLSIF